MTSAGPARLLTAANGRGARRRRLLREIGIAAAIGAALAASPLTGNDLGPALAVGAASGLCVYWLRARRGAAEAPPIASAPDAAKRAPALLVVGALCWLAAFAPTLGWLWHHWTASVWTNNHGIFMPIVMGYLALRELAGDSGDQEESSRWGFAWLVPALAAVALDAVLGTGYLGTLALVATLPGISLLVLGARRTRALRVPLALGLLMVPLPAALATDIGLRFMTASAVEPLLQLLGVSAYREGTVIQLAGAGNTFVVANACSGLATLYASAATAIVLACYAPSRSRRALLLLAAAPLAIGANVLRVLALILLTSGVGRWVMESPLHPATGVAAFAVVLVGLGLLAGRDPLGGAR